MTEKDVGLRKAARQALEALDLMPPNRDTPKSVWELRSEAITALREALAEQSYDEAHGISSYHLQETEQAEQKPAAVVEPFQIRQLVDELETGTKLYAAPQPVKQEPVGRWNWNEAKFEWLTKFDYHKHHMTPLYAAPVQQVDLTDDELNALWHNTKGGWLGLFRAVIAADREKNR